MGRRNRNKNKNKRLDSQCSTDKLNSCIHDGKKEKITTGNSSRSLPVQKEALDVQLSKHDVIPSKKKSAKPKSTSDIFENKDSLIRKGDYNKTSLVNNDIVLMKDKNSSDSKFSTSNDIPSPKKSEKLHDYLFNKPLKNENKVVPDSYGAKPKYKILNEVPELNLCEVEEDASDNSVTEQECINSSLDYSLVPYDRYESKIDVKQNNVKTKENFFSSVDQYKHSKASFLRKYHRWLPERRSTIEKLKSLHKEVHDNVLKYNETQASFKQLSFQSRAAKATNSNQAVDFLASLTAFISDAASGVVSFTQAFNIDFYQTKFQEITKHDSELTEDLYTSRSQCVAKYENIEEVIRNFHSDTFSSTVCKISDTLEVNKHWNAMKHAYQMDNMPQLLNVVRNFFDNACQSEVIKEVSDSVQRYMYDNPATIDACKSSGKALYGAINTFGEKKITNAIMGNIHNRANLYLMMDDKNEVDHLKRVINEDSCQSKLESQIEDAYLSLESEMEEMESIYLQLCRYTLDDEDDDDFNYINHNTPKKYYFDDYYDYGSESE